MPSPVEFSVSLSPLPSEGSWTPQQLAELIAARLTVAPQDEWNSFQIGGSAPTSNIGPWLKNGREWYVFNSGTGAYVPLTTDGIGLLAASVAVSKLAAWTEPGMLLVSNGSNVPTLLPSTGTTDGQVATISTVGGKKTVTWADTFVPAAPGNYFDVRISVPQTIEVGGVTQTVAFDTSVLDPGSQWDGTNFRFGGVSPGQVWCFGVEVQLEAGTGGVTNLEVQLDIRREGSMSNTLGAYKEVASVGGGTVVSTTGMMKMGAGESWVDVGITINGTAAAPGDDVVVAANAANTRFWGYRVL